MKRSELPPPAQFDARDNSGQLVEVVFHEEEKSDQIIRTWSCIDSCGNKTEIKQIITLLPEN